MAADHAARDGPPEAESRPTGAIDGATTARGGAPNAEDATRCGIDRVLLARIERLLADTPPSDLARIFSERELADSGEGTARVASLAARFAAKEACAKLFPRELALGQIEPVDFSLVRDDYGAPQVVVGPQARATLDRHRIRDITVSLTHDRSGASAVALARPMVTETPLAGRLLYRILPLRRRVILENCGACSAVPTPPTNERRPRRTTRIGGACWSNSALR
jgi:holo-[acyl-carrier protein] synthase